jgi:CRP/FNR family transcriptional regulator, nitrogen fixation regulation protein
MNFMTMENPNLSDAGYPQNQQLRSKRPEFVPLLPTAYRANEDSRTSTKCTGDGHPDPLGNNTSANTVPASNSSVPTKLTLSALQIGTLGDYSGRTVLPVSTRAIWNSESTLESTGTIVPFSKGSQIYGAGNPADYLYSIISGVARCYRVTADGRRQIVGFYVPGDLFGFGCGDKHILSIDAVSKTSVRIMRRTALTSLAARDVEVAQRLWIGLVEELCRNQRHILRLGTTARARIASFLLELDRRTSNTGTVELAIPRQDMADYLSITIETASRTLTQLARMSAIAFFGARKIEILNHKLLKRLTSETGR